MVSAIGDDRRTGCLTATTKCLKDPPGPRDHPSTRVYPDALPANSSACGTTLSGEQGHRKNSRLVMGENEIDEGAAQSESEGEKRDFAADERDQRAAERDAADLRDEIADERDKIADAHDAELDERERQIDERAESLGLSLARTHESAALAARRRAAASTLRVAASPHPSSRSCAGSSSVGSAAPIGLRRFR